LVDGLVVKNPFQQLGIYSIIQLNMPPVLFIIFSLLYSRLFFGSKKFLFFITKISKYAHNGFFEINHKTFEALIMPTLNKSYLLKPMSSLKLNEPEILRQRFFSRQKKIWIR